MDGGGARATLGLALLLGGGMFAYLVVTGQLPKFRASLAGASVGQGAASGIGGRPSTGTSSGSAATVTTSTGGANGGTQ